MYGGSNLINKCRLITENGVINYVFVERAWGGTKGVGPKVKRNYGQSPFTEGCPGVNNKASPPGRHQEQTPKQRCTFSPTTFSSVQFNMYSICICYADARGCLAWTSLGIILFLRSLYSKFNPRERIYCQNPPGRSIPHSAFAAGSLLPLRRTALVAPVYTSRSSMSSKLT